MRWKTILAQALLRLVPRGLRQPVTAHAQTPPATFYGRGLTPGDVVRAHVSGRPCSNECVVNEKGEWVIFIPTTADCIPTAGALVTFTVNGVESHTKSVWQGGGLPDDIEWGLELR